VTGARLRINDFHCCTSLHVWLIARLADKENADGCALRATSLILDLIHSLTIIYSSVALLHRATKHDHAWRWYHVRAMARAPPLNHPVLEGWSALRLHAV
jgi:hypothetical protein